jgi:glycerophosphoryl diester phosphodiesterase
MTKGREPDRKSQSGRTRQGKTLGKVEVSNGFGANTHEPYVEVNWPTDSGSIQLDPDEARLIARMIAEAAEAADQDAFLISFMMDDIGLDFDQAAQIIPRFAAWRRERWDKQKTPSA